MTSLRGWLRLARRVSQWRRSSPGSRIGPFLRGLETPLQPPPPAEQAVGRKKDDQQEHPADHEVEALAVDHVDREILQKHEDRGADEGADRMTESAQHRDDEDVDE